MEEEVVERLVAAMTAEIDTGEFLSSWQPSPWMRRLLQKTLAIGGRYQARLIQTKFRALSQERRNTMIHSLLVAPCRDGLVAALGEHHLEPFPDEMALAVEVNLENFPPVIIRLVLLLALVDPGVTSPGVVEFAAFGLSEIQRPGDPGVAEPEFEIVDGELESPLQADSDSKSVQTELMVSSMSHERGLDSGISGSSDMEGKFSDLRAAHNEAIAAGGRLLQRISAAQSIDFKDIETIRTYGSLFDKLRIEVSDEVGKGLSSDDSITDLDEQHRRAMKGGPFEHLSRLTLMVSDREVDCLEDVIRSVEGLRAVLRPSPAETELADRLAVLLKVLERGSESGDFDGAVRVLSLDLPADWSELAYAVKFGHVRLRSVAPPATPIRPKPEARAKGVKDRSKTKTAEDSRNEPAEPSSATSQIGEGASPASRAQKRTKASTGPEKGDQLTDGPSPGRLAEPPTDGLSSPAESDFVADFPSTVGEMVGEDALGRHFLRHGQLIPLYHWLRLDVAGSDIELVTCDLVRAAILLDGSRSPFDEFAYRAADSLMLASGTAARSGTAAHAMTMALAIVGAASTGLGGFTSSLSILIDRTTNLSAGQRTLLRRLVETPLGSVPIMDFAEGAFSEGAPASAGGVEVSWALEFQATAPRRRMKIQPATVVWQELVKADGTYADLGRMASIVASDDRLRVDEVDRFALGLEDRRNVGALIDRVSLSSPRLRRHREIDGSARQWLIEDIEDVVRHLRRWVKAVRADSQPAVSSRSSLDRIGRDEVEEVVTRLLQEVDHDGLRERLGVLTVQALARQATADAESTGGDLDAWLSWEVDAHPGCPSSDSLVTRAELAPLASSPRSMSDVLADCEALLAGGAITRVTRVAGAIGRLDPEVSTQLTELLEAARRRSLRSLLVTADRIEALVGQARASGVLTDEEASDVLTDVELARLDAGAAVESFSRILVDRVTMLRSKIEVQKDLLSTRINASFETGEVTDAQRLQLMSRLADDDVRTVEELLARLDAGGQLGGAVSDLYDVREFFPTKVDAAASLKVSWDLVKSLENGADIGPFRMSELGSEGREMAVNALRCWVEMAGSDRTEQAIADVSDRLLGALGVRFDGRGTRPRLAPHGRGLLFMEYSGIRRFGRAMIPEFGSQMPGNVLRLLFVFEETTSRKLVEVLKQDSSGHRVLVVYLPGVLDVEERRTAANLCRRADLLAPVVDLAVFLELLLSPESDRFERLMHLTLPFTWTNPYVPHVAGGVPAEMFHGRKQELQQVIARQGPSFVYGGRQLGKSALLRRAQLEITEREQHARSIYLDLNEHGVGLFAPPETLWVKLAEKLHELGILTSSGVTRFEPVKSAVVQWLAGEPTRRLLVLLDECDAFLEADFGNQYQVSQQIRGLMADTDRRCKFVLAGLNLVQRFDRGTNHPMAHLAGSSVEIGPLDGSAAFRLVREPLHALGIRFEGDDLSLVYKILSATNDQASLIQLVCDRLLRRVATSSFAAGSPGPVISAEDVRVQLADRELRSEISRRFEWTISLDGRYQVIAYRMALEAREGSPRLSSPDLFVLVQVDWPAAFQAMSEEVFGWYLRELSTFGVLREKDGEWMLRSPNLIELIGSASDVEARLRGITGRPPEERLDPTKLRYPIGASGQPGPLAGDQIAQVFAVKSAPALLIGSQLSGVSAAVQSIEHMGLERGLDVIRSEVLVPSSVPDLHQTPNDAGRLHLVDVRGAKPIDCRAILERVDEVLGGPHTGDVHVVVIAEPDQQLDDRYPSRTIVLRRWDAPSIRRRFEMDNVATSDEELAEIVAISGGWHALLEPAFSRKRKSVETFVGALAPAPASLEEYISAMGLGRLTGVRDVLLALAGGEQCSESDLVEVFDVPAPTVRTLEAVGTLNLQSRGLVLEPVAARAVGLSS